MLLSPHKIFLYSLTLGHFRLHSFVSLLQALLRDIQPRPKLLYLKEKLLLCFTCSYS